MALLLFALIAAPMLVSWVPREIGRWHLAAALENRTAGERERAYQNLQVAIDWDAEQAAYYLQRAEWRTDDRDYEAALADCNRAFDLVGENVTILQARAQVYQHLARHGAAIADWKRIDKISETSGKPTRAEALNGLAYARAVGKLELSEGLQNVEEALQLEPGTAAMLDTRGYLRYLNEEYAAALTDLDPAVKQVEAEYAALQKVEKEGQALVSNTQVERMTKHMQFNIAVIRYHRSLVLDKLDRPADAKKDRARAKALIGREPDETLF